MRLLLDTQIALWWLTCPKRIVPSVRDWVEQAEDGVFVSRASLWELAIKISLGKLRLDLPKFVRQAERDGFFWLSIDTRHLLAVAEPRVQPVYLQQAMCRCKAGEGAWRACQRRTAAPQGNG